jgi:hypothetical protein
MAEAKNAGNSGHPAGSPEWVRKLVGDQGEPKPVTVVTGYLAKSPEAEHTRLYLNVDLSNWLDIPTKAILHEQPVEAAKSALGGTMLWVDQTAKIKPGGAQASAASGMLLRPIQFTQTACGDACVSIQPQNSLCSPCSTAAVTNCPVCPTHAHTCGCPTTVPVHSVCPPNCPPQNTAVYANTMCPPCHTNIPQASVCPVCPTHVPQESVCPPCVTRMPPLCTHMPPYCPIPKLTDVCEAAMGHAVMPHPMNRTVSTMPDCCLIHQSFQPCYLPGHTLPQYCIVHSFPPVCVPQTIPPVCRPFLTIQESICVCFPPIVTPGQTPAVGGGGYGAAGFMQGPIMQR